MAHESTLWRTTTETPLGPYTIFLSDAGVVRTHFDADGGADDDLDAVEDRRRTAPIRREVDAYFRGRLRAFETPADLSAIGEGFTRRVLETVRTIPYGELWTYGDVAAVADAPRAGRAAGSALARSPIELFVPCHRVVRAGPSLGSYGRHDDRRRFLLRLEGALPGASPRA
ncbi:MAG TPA: methylated-DNA--[protein]-cysteine S-methyltransferase [Actinomycetota bacterium]|nr:methylated-DNA--[protein]-cysteine S-methyltransferase [Actinomycetota bacterium]